MKLFKLMLAVALVAIVALALASCGCEHTYDQTVTTVPTCTEKGETTYTCSLCGNAYTEKIDATGHTYKEKVTAPTCTEEGYTTYTCACGDTYKDNTVAATGHTYNENVTAPTCTEEGYTTYTCACGDTYKDNTVAATGVHTYVEGVAPASEELKAKYPTAIGVMSEVCTDCGAANASAATGDVVLVNLDFETKAVNLLDYIEESPNVDPYFGNSSVTTGLIQKGKWYNTSYDQILFDDESGLKSYNEFTVSLDFLLCNEGTSKNDCLFGWGAHGESKPASYFFQLGISDDGKLEYYRNSSLRSDPTAALAGFTFEDRSAWYHMELKVNVSEITVEVSIGKWTDDTLTTLEDFRVIGTTKDTGFETRIPERDHDLFRFGYRNGYAAIDNFRVTVPAA